MTSSIEERARPDIGTRYAAGAVEYLNRLSLTDFRHDPGRWMIPNERDWLADMQSGDAARQVRALHAACPCTGSSRLYERYQPLLHEMKKDPRPEVRRVALHLEEDALDLLAIADERASGFTRNRPGGWGWRREPRRNSVRLGLV